MNRNYIGELKTSGLRVKDITARTGVSQYRLRKILLTGEYRGNEYESIRNLNRKVGYKTLRRLGLDATESNKLKRIVLDEDFKPMQVQSTRLTKRALGENYVQIHILGIFSREHEDVIKDVISEGWSTLAIRITNENSARLTNEAINHAKSKLPGSGWVLVKLLKVDRHELQGGKHEHS